MSKPDTWMPLYIGDYLRDTTRLTTEQHGAYLLLIMDYWTNGPLPDDDAALAQVTRLQPSAWKKNRPALVRMFQVIDGEWHHKRIDEEIENARQFIAKQKANGAKGGRPKKTQTESQEKPTGFDRDNPNSNPNISPSPSPSPGSISELSAGVDGKAGTPAGEVCARLKREGILDVNPMHPRLLALLAAGLTVDEIASVAPEARQKSKGFAWILATAEGRRRDAANVVALPKKIEAPWFLSASKIEEMGPKKGIVRGPDELFPIYKNRVFQAYEITDEMVRNAQSDFSQTRQA